MHYGTKVNEDIPGPDEFLDGQKNVETARRKSARDSTGFEGG